MTKLRVKLKESYNNDFAVCNTCTVFRNKWIVYDSSKTDKQLDQFIQDGTVVMEECKECEEKLIKDLEEKRLAEEKAKRKELLDKYDRVNKQNHEKLKKDIPIISGDERVDETAIEVEETKVEEKLEVEADKSSQSTDKAWSEEKTNDVENKE